MSAVSSCTIPKERISEGRGVPVRLEIALSASAYAENLLFGASGAGVLVNIIEFKKERGVE